MTTHADTTRPDREPTDPPTQPNSATLDRAIKIYCAQWLLPIASPAVEDGAVAVEGTRIVAVGARAAVVARYPVAPLEDFGAAAIMPGLVNCHSHLELTAMRGFLEDVEGDFLAWLRKLTVARLTRMTADDLRVSATWGAVEAARAGITCLGDAATAGEASMSALLDVGLRGIVYQEAINPDANGAAETLEKLRADVARMRALENRLVRVGVSPHAPYTVSERLLRGVAEYALAENLPLMIHAAESAAEDELLKRGRGAFAESYARRGIEWTSPRMSPVQYLAACGVLETRPLLAHCVRVDATDIELIKEARASIAHCPKSNLKLGHGRAPLALMRDVAHGFGSDSVASNNTCDLLEEARFATLLARLSQDTARDDNDAIHDAHADSGAHDAHTMYTAHDALRDATHGGAHALSLNGLTGALQVGLEADITIVDLNGAHQTPVYNPAHTLIFSASARDVALTLVAGREVYRDGKVLTVDEAALRARMEEIKEKVIGDK